MIVVLTRVSHSLGGTPGVLSMVTPEGLLPFCLTLERPWLANTPFVSCIPAGEYTCQQINSETFGDTFQIMNIVGRTEVVFHHGNQFLNSHGCVLLGTKFGPHLTILDSKIAFNLFKNQLLGLKNFTLIIKNPPIV